MHNFFSYGVFLGLLQCLVDMDFIPSVAAVIQATDNFPHQEDRDRFSLKIL